MARTIDFVFEFAASNKFVAPTGAEENGKFIDTKLYDASSLRAGRTLIQYATGSTRGPNDNFSDSVEDVIRFINGKVNGNFEAMGAVCIYGTSNGSFLAVALAEALRKRGALGHAFVGVGDLPLMPFGRSPAVSGIGPLQPRNAPEVGFIHYPTSLLGARVMRVSVETSPPPRVAVGNFRARVLRNYTQRRGNKAHVVSQTPSGFPGWWWTSSQTDGEVHGFIDDWDNVELPVESSGSIVSSGPGTIDEGFHDSLCGKALLRLRQDVAQALAILPR